MSELQDWQAVVAEKRNRLANKATILSGLIDDRLSATVLFAQVADILATLNELSAAEDKVRQIGGK